MTEPQPTEIELTGKKRRKLSVSKRKILAVISSLVVIIVIIILTVIMASHASKSPDLIQPSVPGSLPKQSK